MSLVALGSPGFDLESFARVAGMHPELVLRFVTLGLLEPQRDGRDPVFTDDDVARACRIRRLRAGFCLNYAAMGLVLDLLDRVDALEAAVRARPRPDASRDSRRTGG